MVNNDGRIDGDKYRVTLEENLRCAKRLEAGMEIDLKHAARATRGKFRFKSTVTIAWSKPKSESNEELWIVSLKIGLKMFQS